MSVLINKQTTAALDVDAQNGFTPLCPNELPVEGGHEIVAECLQNHTKARFKIMSKDAHPAWGKWNVDRLPTLTPIGEQDVDVAWPGHCVVGTPGFELLTGLPHPREYNFFIYKGAEFDMHPYSPIYQDLAKTISTGIIEWAHWHGVTTFIVGGLALNVEDTPLCVGHGVIDLAEAGFKIILNLGAVRGLGSEDGRNRFIKMLIEKYGVVVITSADEIITS